MTRECGKLRGRCAWGREVVVKAVVPGTAWEVLLARDGEKWSDADQRGPSVSHC